MLILNSPASSVVTPPLLPFIFTVTPGKGLPASSVTFPFNVGFPCWAFRLLKVIDNTVMAKTVKINTRRFSDKNCHLVTRQAIVFMLLVLIFKIDYGINCCESVLIIWHLQVFPPLQH